MSNETDTSKKSSNGIKVIIAIAAVVIVALLVVIVILLSRGGKQEENRENATARGVVVNQSNAEQVVDDMVLTPYVEPGYYEASMTNVWHFKDSSSVSEDAFVENVSGNTNDVYFDVFLSTDEENPIIQSPVIPRGVQMDQIKLDKELDAGTYDCVLIYHLVDDNQETVSTLRVGITIVVEN